MKYPLFLLFLLSTSAFSQNQNSFFRPEKMVEIGVYYYPEAWPQEQWARDFKNMKAMGFEFTHFAEFAWSKMEPEEGKYNFEWLDKAVDLAAKEGLKVIMCTPTPTPPVWLVRKYPEVLIIDENGQRAQHGTREHYSWSSKKYRELTEGIVTQLAKRYGSDKRIWGWQIDNEPSHNSDYNPEARINFIEWLKKKYGTIDKLNDVWGTVFWSGTYNNFEQIELPKGLGLASPTQVLDFKRFCADECASYIGFQNKVLRKYISKEQFVTSNFMGFYWTTDPWRNRDLDFICYTVYPVGGFTDGLGDQGFRVGDPYQISWANDFFRPLKGVTGVMELQPGQVNWGNYNTQPLPGAIRAWLWNAFAGDLSFICSYRYRQPLFGSEQYHNAMVNTDGVTQTTGGKEYSTFISEVKKLRELYNPEVKVPSNYEKRKTAVLFNRDILWNMDIQKQTYQWNYTGHTAKIYNIIKSFTVPVDIIPDSIDIKGYNIVVAPAYQLLDSALIQKWKKYAENGGNLILTSRTGQKDRNGRFFEASWAKPIQELIGGKVLFFDVLPGNRIAKIVSGDSVYKWNIWADILEPGKGTEVWAKYADQFYAGKAAVTYRKLGKGSVTYIGTETNDSKLEKEILKKVYQNASIPIQEQAEGVVVHYRDGFWVAVNYSPNKIHVNIPSDAKIVIGTSDIEQAGVVVWTEQ